MIDTHAHLTTRFTAETKVTGVKVILAASNVVESKENVELVKLNIGQFWASVGIHPQCTDPKNNRPIMEQLEELQKLIEKNRKMVVAVGETGLDFSTPPPEERERSKEEQEELFRGQIEIAQKFDLPLIIHARKAIEEVIKILAEHKETRGVFHCYTGGKKRINRILELGSGWYFGIDGNITYEIGLPEVVAAIPKDRLLAETDSPFLAPVPFRGERNKPEYVKYIYKKIGEIWGISSEGTERILDENAFKLFKIGKDSSRRSEGRQLIYK